MKIPATQARTCPKCETPVVSSDGLAWCKRCQKYVSVSRRALRRQKVKA